MALKVVRQLWEIKYYSWEEERGAMIAACTYEGRIPNALGIVGGGVIGVAWYVVSK